MVQPAVRCIKLGEVLLDENRKMLVFCTQCLTDYEHLQDFQQHLEYCHSASSTDGPSLQGIFQDNVSLVFPVIKRGQDTQNMLARYVNSNGKEYQVYNCDGIKRLEQNQHSDHCKLNTNDDDLMDLIKIEEELLDPRWYTELGSTQIVADHTIGHQPIQQKRPASYHELVEAVTPFVHFKENFKTNNDNNKKFMEQNVNEAPKTKNQILNGVKSGSTLSKSNEQDSASVVKTFIISNPRFQTSLTTTTTNVALLNNSNKSIPSPVSNSNCNKLPVSQNVRSLPANNSSIKLPVNTNSKVKQIVGSNKKLPNGSNSLKNSSKGPADAVKNNFKHPVGSSNILKQPSGNTNSTQPNTRQSKSVELADKNKQKLPLLNRSTTCNVPALNALTASSTLQQNKSNTAAVKTDNQHYKTSLKRNNDTAAGSTSAKQLKLNECGTSAAANLAEIPSLKVISKALPGKTAQTQQILNKLQNLGLQVKIKEPESKQEKSSSSLSTNPEKEKTLQIIKKLQLKGMNIKIVPPLKAISSVENHHSDFMLNNKLLDSNVKNLNKNLIIKKLN